jgi:hypothetical protein
MKVKNGFWKSSCENWKRLRTRPNSHVNAALPTNNSTGRRPSAHQVPEPKNCFVVSVLRKIDRSYNSLVAKLRNYERGSGKFRARALDRL